MTFRHKGFRGLQQGCTSLLLLLTHHSCKEDHCKCLPSNPLLAPPSPAMCQVVMPSHMDLAGHPPQPKEGLHQGLKIKLYLSLNTPLLVLAAPFQVSLASPGKQRSCPEHHKPAALLRGLLSPGRYLRTYHIHNSTGGRVSPRTNAAAASTVQGVEKGAGSRFTVRLLFGSAGNESGKLALTSSRPNKHCIHMQSYGANDLSVVHLENRFHQPGLNDYIAAACASSCSGR